MTTGIDFAEQEKAIRKRGFEQHLEYFIKTFAPKDPDQRAEFEMRLIRLVQEIYADAQAPLHDHMMKLYSVLPLTLPLGTSR